MAYCVDLRNEPSHVAYSKLYVTRLCVACPNVQTELMLEIYSKRLVRAVGKVLLMKFSLNTNLRS